jgi:hypothetical protein
MLEPAMPRHDITRDGVLAALKRYAADHGEQFPMRDFCAELGVSPSTLLRRCGPWRDLRRDAGLKLLRATPSVTYSEEFLVAEYRRLCRELGRPPTSNEFERRAQCGLSTLHRRIGRTAAIRRRAQVADEFAACFGRDLGEFFGKKRFSWDEAWLAELWKRVRVGFALCSSDLQGRDPFPCDVVFCAEHDWPLCPAPVVVAHRALGERATARGTPPPAST